MEHYPILYGNTRLRRQVWHNVPPVVENGTTFYAYEGYEAPPVPPYSHATAYPTRSPSQVAAYPHIEYHYQPFAPSHLPASYAQSTSYVPTGCPPNAPSEYMTPPPPEHSSLYGAHVPHSPPVGGLSQAALNYYPDAAHQHESPLIQTDPQSNVSVDAWRELPGPRMPSHYPVDRNDSEDNGYTVSRANTVQPNANPTQDAGKNRRRHDTRKNMKIRRLLDEQLALLEMGNEPPNV